MATIIRCDGCGSTGGGGRPVPDLRKTKPAGDGWWSVTCSSKESAPRVYDLCGDCYKNAAAAAKKPQVTINDLPPREIALLQQIWANAQNFDQSIGDIRPDAK